jgi:DNA-directed RNA polymerase specialized sigma subunit
MELNHEGRGLVHYENPAKRFLRGYRALLVRRDSLLREIERRRESATGTTVRLKEINVQSGGASDRMAEDVARIVDDEASLGDALAEITKRLREILQAIESVPDEMQKTVLTLRYIEGLDWIAISEKINYEERMTFILHGKGLVGVNKWLEKKTLQENAVVNGLE